MTSGVDINLSLRKQDGKMTVIVLPRNSKLNDNQQQLFVPMTLSGTPQMLDNEFATVINEPLKKASSLLCNLKIPEKQPQSNKEAKESKGKYDLAFKKGEDFEKQKKYKEALACYEEAKTFAKPSNMKVIDDKIASMQSWTKQGNLLDLMDNSEQNKPEPEKELQTQAKQTPLPLLQLPGEEINEETPPDFRGNRLLPESIVENDFDNVDFPLLFDNNGMSNDYNSISY